MDITLRAIGYVRSPLTDADAAPKQGDEGAPEAAILLEEEVLPALADTRPGDNVIVLTWLDRADRDVLKVHPRDDLTRPSTGVFATRSQDRPNPVGVHRVEVVSVEGAELTVNNLEALDGTPVVDIKPVLSADPADR